MEKNSRKIIGLCHKTVAGYSQFFFDEFLRTMQFLWKSGCLLVWNDYDPMCV